jgi:hypothetical protein
MFRTFKKYLSHDTVPLKDVSGCEDMTNAFLMRKQFYHVLYNFALDTFPNSSKMRKIRQFGIIGVYTIFSFFYKSLNKL